MDGNNPLISCNSTSMYTCVCIYIYKYLHTYIRTYTPTYLLTYLLTYLPTYLPTYLHTYIHTYIHIHTHIHTYKHTNSNIQTYKHTNIQTYKHTNKQTNIHTYIRTYVRTYIHTYIHTYIPSFHTPSFFVTHHLSHTTLSHTIVFTSRSFLCLSFLPRPATTFNLLLIIGRSWHVGLSGPLISFLVLLLLHQLYNGNLFLLCFPRSCSINWMRPSSKDQRRGWARLILGNCSSLHFFAISSWQVQAEHAKAKGAELRKTPPHTDLLTATSSMHFWPFQLKLRLYGWRRRMTQDSFRATGILRCSQRSCRCRSQGLKGLAEPEHQRNSSDKIWEKFHIYPR